MRADNVKPFSVVALVGVGGLEFPEPSRVQRAVTSRSCVRRF